MAGFRMCDVGAVPVGTPQRPSEKYRAVLAWAPPRLNRPEKSGPSQEVTSARRERSRCATCASLNHDTSPPRPSSSSTSPGGQNCTAPAQSRPTGVASSGNGEAIETPKRRPQCDRTSALSGRSPHSHGVIRPSP